MFGAVDLSRNPHRPRALTIYVPRGHDDRSPFGFCHVCGAQFFAGQEALWERHVGDCARANIDRIRSEAPSVVNKGGPFDPETWDPEEEAHLLRVGRRMRQEGRFEVKPHERPGAGGGGVL